jgi:hypothetical protein
MAAHACSPALGLACPKCNRTAQSRRSGQRDTRSPPAGRIGSELLRALPDGVDPCGENGEFHTFAADGRGFASPLDVIIGEMAERDGFVFTDVLPATPGRLRSA